MLQCCTFTSRMYPSIITPLLSVLSQVKGWHCTSVYTWVSPGARLWRKEKQNQYRRNGSKYSWRKNFSHLKQSYLGFLYWPGITIVHFSRWYKAYPIFNQNSCLKMHKVIQFPMGQSSSADGHNLVCSLEYMTITNCCFFHWGTFSILQ